MNLTVLTRGLPMLLFLLAGIVPRTWAAQNIAAAPGDPPVIDEQPIDRKATAGGFVVLSVLARDTASMSFQWFTNNTATPLTNSSRVTGVTNSVLNIDPAFTTDSGGYSVVVTSSGGSTTSRVASVMVSNLLAFPTATGSTGVMVLLVGQIGDVYRAELNTNFTGYKTNGYVTNFTGTATYTYRWPIEPGVFHFNREAVDRVLPVLYPAGVGSVRAYGKLNQVWRLDASTDLQFWFSFGTFTNTAGWWQFYDPRDFVPSQSFFRITPP